MKKNRFALIMILLISALPVFATLHSVDTKSFDLQGGYDAFFNISLTPLDAYSHDFLAGMPFDLESKAIANDTQEGILIAEWSMISNQANFTLEVNAEPLKHNETQERVDYILIFDYPLSYYVDSTSVSGGENIRFTVSSNPAESGLEETNPVKNAIGLDPETFVGTTSGEVYFKLSKNTLVNGQEKPTADWIAKIPAGPYSAHVTVNIKLVN